MGVSKLSNKYATESGAETFSNKRIVKRISSVASATSITPNGDAFDVTKVDELIHNVTFATPSGTPTDEQEHHISVRASGANRTINFSSDYSIASLSSITFPFTVTDGQKLRVHLRYDLESTKWDIVAFVTSFI